MRENGTICPCGVFSPNFKVIFASTSAIASLKCSLVRVRNGQFGADATGETQRDYNWPHHRD